MPLDTAPPDEKTAPAYAVLDDIVEKEAVVDTTPSAVQAEPSSFVSPSTSPTQEGPRGIRYDFNEGARISLPQRETGSWRVILRDLDTGNILFRTDTKGAQVRSSKRYYVRFRLEVLDVMENGDTADVLVHDYDASGRDVLIQLPIGTLGDSLAWFPYVERFASTHGARVTCIMSPLIAPLLRDAYPGIRLVSPKDVADGDLLTRVYATYYIGLFFTDIENIHQPTDFRLVGLHRAAGYILGVSAREEAPRLSLADDTRPLAEPYVCIAVQSSTQCKCWNNPTGWREVVAFLKDAGYRVVCIDQKPVNGRGIVWTHMPHGVEDETGDRPLAERARWLRHAAFFIGLSSGLSWLAWAAGTPVVMISGFTHPTNEFETPYRVINWHACNSCWNDPRLQFDHHDFLWCPRHKGTDRQFECTRLITSQQVIRTISSLPPFHKT